MLYLLVFLKGKDNIFSLFYSPLKQIVKSLKAGAVFMNSCTRCLLSIQRGALRFGSAV